MNDRLDNPALKEWASIWDAVIEGRQVIDLRKGGIREQGHRFRIRAARFWLYDSYEHQRADLLRPLAAERLAAVDALRPAGDHLRFTGWAEIAAVASIDEPHQLAKLDSEFIWTADYAAQRLQWRPKQPLWLLVLRAYRLDTPIEVPVQPEYAGCASWVPMQDLPPDPAMLVASPVLSDHAFAARVASIRAALPGVPFEDDIQTLLAES